MLTKLGELQLAFGLDWSYASTKQEAKQLLKSGSSQEGIKSARSRVKIFRKESEETWLGFYNGKLSGTTYPAVVIVGLVEANAVICHELGEDAYWLCVVTDGLPSVGYDQIVTAEAYRSLVEEHVNMFSRHTLIGSFAGAKRSMADIFESVESAVADATLNRKTLKQFALVPEGVSVSKVTALSIAGLVVAGAMFGYQTYRKELASAAMKMQSDTSLAKAMLSESELASAKQADIAKFKKVVEDKRSELSSDRPAGTVMGLWTQWQQAKLTLPPSKYGYVPTQMTCTVTGCLTIWDGRGKLVSIADKPLLSGKPEMDLEKTVVSEIALAPRPPNAVGPQVQRWADGQALRFALAVALEQVRTGSSVTISEAEPITVAPPPNLGLKPVAVGYVGTIKLIVTGPLTPVVANDLMTVLNRFPVNLKTVKFIGIGQSPSLDIEADFKSSVGQV